MHEVVVYCQHGENMKKNVQKGVVIYQAKNGAIEFRGDFTHETLWATQKQIAEAFGVNVRTINEHIKNVFKTQELREDAVIRNFRITASDGKTYNTNHYNLDMIISVGYRVNSKTATHFRQWATKTLREHITKGYTINRKQIGKNYDAFMKAVSDIQAMLPSHVTLDPSSVIELIKEFSSTWVSLDAYDKESLKRVGTTKRAVKLSGIELTEAIANLRSELMKKKEAEEIFAQERMQGSVEGIVGNVMQAFGGAPMYKTIEEKAAHLLYFMVKNHPFIDGNKRSGAFAFIWFLRKGKVLRKEKMSPEALTALTLLVAESDPKDQDKVVALIVQLLS
jgi:prophage maintenance system killer protein